MEDSITRGERPGVEQEDSSAAQLVSWLRQDGADATRFPPGNGRSQLKHLEEKTEGVGITPARMEEPRGGKQSSSTGRDEHSEIG